MRCGNCGRVLVRCTTLTVSTNVYLYHGPADLSFIRVEPGDWVVVKPNLVKEENRAHPGEWRSVITSGELIEQVCETVAAQLHGRGKITICDAPQTDSRFTRIAELLELEEIARRVAQRHAVKVEIVDLRAYEWTARDEVVVARRDLPGDPAGAIAFNLGRASLFFGHRGEGRYYGADYDAGVVNGHHRGETQEYLICGTPIQCDVFINLPKLKTHKKTGVTLNLKNLVGINADKNWLPHHTEGGPANGGDQFPELSLRRRTEQVAVAAARKIALSTPLVGPALVRQMRKAGKVAFGDNDRTVRSGNWHGNDTTWRMALDLNRCLLYGNPDGSLRTRDPKRYFCVIDGRVGMEGDGPMNGDPIESNVVIGGSDPAVVDMVAARVMGFDWRKLPIIREAFLLSAYPITGVRPEAVQIVSDVSEWRGPFLEREKARFLNFRPHFGWSGHIEYEG